MIRLIAVVFIVSIFVLSCEEDIPVDPGDLDNLAEADDFLVVNRNQPGVIQTQSGLQYKIIVNGTGVKPEIFDEVRVRYSGTFVDGTVFNSGTTVTYAVNEFNPGLTEALLLMSEGSKWEIYVHPNLAYGKEGYQNIPSNKLLIYDFELIIVNP
ncbi:FKBP-type peptidyl-prolyl cis-trans isomerase [candidate division KSB1 bacterium]